MLPYGFEKFICYWYRYGIDTFDPLFGSIVTVGKPS